MTPRGRPGFSIIELIVAVGILATSIILIVGIMATLLNSSQKSVDLTAGTVLAESLMSQEAYQVLSKSAIDKSNFFQPIYGLPTQINGGNYAVNNQTFFYKIYVQDVTMGTNLYSSGVVTPMKRMDIMLWWWDANGAAVTGSGGTGAHTGRAGMGMLEVSLSRLLWPSAAF